MSLLPHPFSSLPSPHSLSSLSGLHTDFNPFLRMMVLHVLGECKHENDRAFLEKAEKAIHTSRDRLVINSILTSLHISEYSPKLSLHTSFLHSPSTSSFIYTYTLTITYDTLKKVDIAIVTETNVGLSEEVEESLWIRIKNDTEERMNGEVCEYHRALLSDEKASRSSINHTLLSNLFSLTSLPFPVFFTLLDSILSYAYLSSEDEEQGKMYIEASKGMKQMIKYVEGKYKKWEKYGNDNGRNGNQDGHEEDDRDDGDNKEDDDNGKKKKRGKKRGNDLIDDEAVLSDDSDEEARSTDDEEDSNEEEEDEMNEEDERFVVPEGYVSYDSDASHDPEEDEDEEEGERQDDEPDDDDNDSTPSFSPVRKSKKLKHNSQNKSKTFPSSSEKLINGKRLRKLNDAATSTPPLTPTIASSISPVDKRKRKRISHDNENNNEDEMAEDDDGEKSVKSKVENEIKSDENDDEFNGATFSDDHHDDDDDDNGTHDGDSLNEEAKSRAVLKLADLLANKTNETKQALVATTTTVITQASSSKSINKSSSSSSSLDPIVNKPSISEIKTLHNIKAEKMTAPPSPTPDQIKNDQGTNNSINSPILKGKHKSKSKARPSPTLSPAPNTSTASSSSSTSTSSSFTSTTSSTTTSSSKKSPPSRDDDSDDDAHPSISNSSNSSILASFDPVPKSPASDPVSPSPPLTDNKSPAKSPLPKKKSKSKDIPSSSKSLSPPSSPLPLLPTAELIISPNKQRKKGKKEKDRENNKDNDNERGQVQRGYYKNDSSSSSSSSLSEHKEIKASPNGKKNKKKDKTLNALKRRKTHE